MNSLTDQQLLQDYIGQRSEAAFAELVRRHIDFVYSAAIRMVCDSHLAQDVTQGVFVALAQNAQHLTERAALAGWLHRTAQNIAANTVRSDVRRRAREQQAAVMNELLAPESDVAWEDIAPHLDDALGELSEPDRDAVLLRYFKRQTAHEIAMTFGISDEAAQKRVSRAVDHLREFFQKRGVTVGASALAILISANAVQAAPAGLAVAITAAAVIAGTTLATVTTATAAKAIVMTTFQKTLVAGVIAAAVGTGIYQAQKAVRLRTEAQHLHDQQTPLTEQLSRLATENDRLSNILAQSKLWDTNQSSRDSAEAKAAQQAAEAMPGDWESQLRAALKLPDGARQKRLVEIARSVALTDMPLAATLGDSLLTSEADRMAFLGTVLTRWVEADPEGALNFAMAYTPARGNPGEKQDFIFFALHTWASKDGEAALAWVNKLPAGTDKQNYLAAVLMALSQTDPEKAIAWLKEMPAGRQRDAAFQRLAATLASKDPKAAAEIAKSIPAGTSRDQFLQQLTAIWTAKDPQAAMDFIIALPPSNSRDELLRSAVSAWARTDPAAAAKFSETMPFNRMWGMTGVAYNWALKDHAAAWEWSKGIADDETRRSSLGGILRSLATHSQLDEAAKYASQLTGDDQVRAIRSLLIDSSDLDPDWTAKWVSKFPSGETRNQAVEKLVQHWSQTDPMATAKWLADQPKDDSFQAGARRLIPGLLKASPQAAWDWAMVISDPTVKQERLETVAKSWLGSDPNAARAKIQASGLSAEQVSTLLNK